MLISAASDGFAHGAVQNRTLDAPSVQHLAPEAAGICDHDNAPPASSKHVEHRHRLCALA